MSCGGLGIVPALSLCQRAKRAGNRGRVGCSTGTLASARGAPAEGLLPWLVGNNVGNLLVGVRLTRARRGWRVLGVPTAWRPVYVETRTGLGLSTFVVRWCDTLNPYIERVERVPSAKGQTFAQNGRSSSGG